MSVGGRLVETRQRAKSIEVPAHAIPGNGARRTNRISDVISGNGKEPPGKVEQVKVTRPNMRTVQIRIVGTAPYLQCAFSQKAMQKIKAKQEAGDIETVGKRPRRPRRDFDADYKGAMHKLPGGECGIPASAFRSAAISACRLVGFKMTIAKLSIFVPPDGFDVVDATPLIKIVGKPERHEMMGRNADGSPDIRVRAIFMKWSATIPVRFDADQFQLVDVINLFMRIGEQVGIGEGRHDSKNSAGLGFGTFEVVQ